MGFFKIYLTFSRNNARNDENTEKSNMNGTTETRKTLKISKFVRETRRIFLLWSGFLNKKLPISNKTVAPL